ncbi:LysR family transcriptional regulator [uncultured Tateyamaria sp.]|uniref:LysR family transcriptional regulator n=1 Tax=uncultured Tateyamaria sp. TaxID=455651 RepID=UPI0026100EC4|nr:LysR family transcriptional regulator [uncultured Tateyamaria sp.]
MDWEDIKTLCAVVQHKTVRAAGEALGVHHTTVGRRIDSLEESLGTSLFNRTPDGLLLTSAGETLYRVAQTFSEALIDAERSIAGLDDELAGPLTVTMPEPLLNVLFMPELPGFTAQHPSIELRFDTSLSIRDVARREADFAVRLDNNPPDTLVGKRLYAYTEAAYATPDYLSRNPKLYRWLGWGAATQGAPEWVRTSEFPDNPVWGVFPTIPAQQAAAREGLGLAILPCLFGDADPDLQRAGKKAPVKSRDIWLLTHNDLRQTARVQAFMVFAETVLRKHRKRLIGES